MPPAPDSGLLAALLDSWERSNSILLNFLRLVPEGGLEARALAGSPSVAQMFTHIHYVRLVLVQEDAPELDSGVPAEEWVDEEDRERIAGMLMESARVVREAVKTRLESGQQMDVHYDHPILLLQHLLWHEAYHQGQMKLALKISGQPVKDTEAGSVTWRLWMDRKGAAKGR